MFKFIKRLFLFFILVIIIVPTVIIVFALMDDANSPNYLNKEEVAEYQDVEKVLLADLDRAVFAFISGDRKIKFHEVEVNKTIYGYFEGFDKEAVNRIGKEINNFYVEGIWVDVETDHLILYTKLAYSRIRTTITAKVEVKTDEDEIILTLSQFKIGKLPIPKFVFSKLLEQFTIELEEGKIDSKTVQFRIKKEVIQRELEKAMDNKLIRFEDLVLGADEISIYYDLNTAVSPEAQTFLEAIDELKQVVEDDTLVSNIENKLNELDIPPQDQEKVDEFLENLHMVNDLIKDKLENPANVTEEELDLFLALQESFDAIPNLQEVIIEAVENSFDEDLLYDLNQILSEFGFGSIAELIFGN